MHIESLVSQNVTSTMIGFGL